MTDPNKTAIAVVLDSSSSMYSCRIATIDGFNAFLNKQREAPGHATMSLMVFSDESTMRYTDVDVRNLAPMERIDFTPYGNTALRDAIGRTITELGAKLAKLPESERPSKVIVVIITDGQENYSRQFTAPQIREMIKHQTDTYNWQFLYLGANQDAIVVGASMGVLRSCSATYSTSNSAEAFETVSSNSVSYRKTGRKADLNFSADQRAQLVDPATP
jgi:hypothetical protein